MKKIAAILPGICLALLPFAAKADTLTFDSSSGTIGPYSMTLSPGGNLSLFCMDDQLHISGGESWSVDVIQGSSLSSNSLTKSDATQYEEEAYILSELGKTSGMYTFDDTAVQDALWAVFDSGDVSGLSSAAKALYDAATGSHGAGATFIADGGYDNYDFYIYNGPCEGYQCSGDPQNFIGDGPPPSAAPEPSGLLLLGTGLTGMAGVMRRKLVRR
jgi:hypothetical protein